MRANAARLALKSQSSEVESLSTEITDIDQMLDDLDAALNGTITAERENELLSRLAAADVETDEASEDTATTPSAGSWESQVGIALEAVNNDWLEVVATQPIMAGATTPEQVRRILDADGRARARANYEQSVIRAGAVIGERADQLIAERIAAAPLEEDAITIKDVRESLKNVDRRDQAAVDAHNDLARRLLDQQKRVHPHDRIRAQVYRDVLNEIRPLGGATAQLAGKRPNKGLVSQVNLVHNDLPAEWTTMINDVAPPLKLQLKTDHRGHYVPGDEEILSGGSESTMYHELGHRMETYVPQISVATNQFLERRTTLPNGVREPERTYARGERVRADGFTESYIGKSYPGVSTEVFSTGLEALFTGEHGGLTGATNRGKDYSADVEHRNLVLGLYASALRDGQPRVDHRSHNMSYSAFA